MKQRSPIRKLSEKRLKSLNGKRVFSSISPSGKGVKRKKRTKSERERIYGPPGYVEWIHRQPCAACKVVGFSECAHIKTGGMGRKDDWTRTIPLCGTFMDHGVGGWPESLNIGCHKMYDEHREDFDEEFPDFNAVEAAAETEKLWLEHSGETK